MAARTQGKPEVDTSMPPDEPIEGEFIDDNEQSNGNASRPASTDALATVQKNALQVKTTYTTAIVVPKPRVLGGKGGVLERVLVEARLCGEDFLYSWTQGKGEKAKLVEGVSIDGAMIMLRNFGNCVCIPEIEEEGPMHWVFKATFIDLETGLTFPRLYRQRKGESHQRSGGDAERLTDIAFQIGQSKAIRNTVVSIMPGWLVSRATAASKDEALKGYKNLPEMVEKARAVFAQIGVTFEQLEAKVGRPSAQWTSDDVRLLIALQKGILSRETSVEREFPKPEPAAAATPGPTPPATGQQQAPPEAPAAAAAADSTAPCVACGKPVPSAVAVHVPPGMRFRHPDCAAPGAPPPPASPPPQATPAAPAAPPAPSPPAAPAATRAAAQGSLPGTAAAAPASTPRPAQADRRRQPQPDDQDDGPPPPDYKGNVFDDGDKGPRK